MMAVSIRFKEKLEPNALMGISKLYLLSAIYRHV